MPHPSIHPDAVAVVTGGASGIGLAAADRLLGAGLRVCLADLAQDRLEAAAASLAEARPGSGDRLMLHETDVSRPDSLRALEAAVSASWGGTDVLMNNAAIQPGSALFAAPDIWDRILAVNLGGMIHGSQIFAPAMIRRSQEDGRARAIINTGSKQGITTPPGDPAYNVAKAGVKAFTEALEHGLRNTEGARLSAHLLIPGFVWTPLTYGDRTEKPAAAWTPGQTVDFMLERLAAGDFYILCPDNDVSRALDEKRIAWAAGDIIHNRPPLSRWHPEHADAFERFASEAP